MKNPARTAFRKFTPRRSLLAAVATFLLFFIGCGKKQLTALELREIAEELTSAAHGIVGPNASVIARPETKATSGRRSDVIAYQLEISLNGRDQEPALVQALAGVARKHDLTRGPVGFAASVEQFDLFRDSRREFTIRILESVVVVPRPRVPLPSGATRLAIIVDDLGEDVTAARELLKLPFPLTVSIIPSLPNSKEIADEAFSRGDEVLLHLPMEASEANAKSEAVELRVGMQPRQVSDILASMLETVPHASGVNNHQGSRATADPALMDTLMPVLRQRGLFFVDSRTTVATVAYTAAERDGVPATFRSARFLDDVEEPSVILTELDRAALDAKRKGWAVTIGHPHPATIAALREGLPRLKALGVHLVFASDVLK